MLTQHIYVILMHNVGIICCITCTHEFCSVSMLIIFSFKILEISIAWLRLSVPWFGVSQPVKSLELMQYQMYLPTSERNNFRSYAHFVTNLK